MLLLLRIETLETEFVFSLYSLTREETLARGWLTELALYDATQTRMKTPILLFRRRKLQSVSALFLLITTAAHADDAPPSRIHELVDFTFASEYVTPRGMLVHDQGLTFQPLFLTLANIYQGKGFVNDLTAVAGCWNDFSSAGVSVNGPYGSKPKTDWTEIDPIGGLSLSFAKDFKLEATYTAFAEQILDIGISQHFVTKLSYDDSTYLKGFALHPHFSYWQELQGKATDADLPYTLYKEGAYPVAPLRWRVTSRSQFQLLF